MPNVTLGSIVLAMGVPTRDNLSGTTSQDATTHNQFIDNRRISQTNDIYNGSEVLWTDYIYDDGLAHVGGSADRNPLSAGPDLVTGFVAGSGTFTMRNDWNTSNGVPSGKHYTLINLRGHGLPFEYRVQAARFAIESMSADGLVTEYQLASAGAANTYDFTVPAGILDTVYAVEIRNVVGATTSFRVPIPAGRSGWTLTPGRGIHINARQVTSPSARVVALGRVYPTWNDDLSTIIPIARDEVVRAALEWMTLYPKGARDNAAHQSLMMDRYRMSSEYWYPNEERLY